jgi:hypothetical protein
MSADTGVSIYIAIGGEPALVAMVDDVYERVLADPQLAGFFATRRLCEAVASFEPGYPRAVQVKLDAVTPAGVSESGLVIVGKRRQLLEPALAARGRQDLDDPRGLVGRIPHGVLDVPGLQCPLSGEGGAYLVSDQDADLAGLDAHP